MSRIADACPPMNKSLPTKYFRSNTGSCKQKYQNIWCTENLLRARQIILWETMVKHKNCNWLFTQNSRAHRAVCSHEAMYSSSTPWSLWPLNFTHVTIVHNGITCKRNKRTPVEGVWYSNIPISTHREPFLMIWYSSIPISTNSISQYPHFTDWYTNMPVVKVDNKG